jgi:hypothetical protein
VIESGKAIQIIADDEGISLLRKALESKDEFDARKQRAFESELSNHEALHYLWGHHEFL